MPYRALIAPILEHSFTAFMSAVTGLCSGLLYIFGTLPAHADQPQINANTSIGVNLYALCSIIGGVVLATWVVGSYFHKIMSGIKTLSKSVEKLQTILAAEQEKSETRGQLLVHLETQIQDLACKTPHGCPIPKFMPHSKRGK